MSKIMGICTEFSKSYKGINLRFKSKEPKKYDIAIIAIHLEEIDRNFIVKRINKTNNKGTKVIYKSITNKEEFDNYIKFLKELIKNFNEKWGEDVKLG